LEVLEQDEQIIPRQDHLLILFQYFEEQQRIYTDGRGFPEDLENTPMGYSIGRWEGSTGTGRRAYGSTRRPRIADAGRRASGRTHRSPLALRASGRTYPCACRANRPTTGRRGRADPAEASRVSVCACVPPRERRAT